MTRQEIEERIDIRGMPSVTDAIISLMKEYAHEQKILCCKTIIDTYHSDGLYVLTSNIMSTPNPEI